MLVRTEVILPQVVDDEARRHENRLA